MHGIQPESSWIDSANNMTQHAQREKEPETRMLYVNERNQQGYAIRAAYIVSFVSVNFVGIDLMTVRFAIQSILFDYHLLFVYNICHLSLWTSGSSPIESHCNAIHWMHATDEMISKLAKLITYTLWHISFDSLRCIDTIYTLNVNMLRNWMQLTTQSANK